MTARRWVTYRVPSAQERAEYEARRSTDPTEERLFWESHGIHARRDHEAMLKTRRAERLQRKRHLETLKIRRLLGETDAA